ncbi:hypothetical protein R3W88_026998 [Solanum pinnatisectum]|uniref:Uncharacterized protein n=1 Tax=Solanum pinnatisectum TaxID=50273 RepID=A0AAV9LHI6_9SOLN|nr:hypothetical protein R3W88_026998 [Solanum pinnatisectum]
MDFEFVEVSHNYSAIMTSNVVVKKDDSGAFTIPCTNGMFQFAKVLCDLGASVKLMPFAIYKKLGLGEPKSTTMGLLMADRSIKRPMGILYNILVKVDIFIFPANFVILDCEIDAKVPIILSRPFLVTRRALVDVVSGELNFRSLATILLNYDGEEIQDYDEVVASLLGLGSYSKCPLKLDVNLKNR